MCADTIPGTNFDVNLESSIVTVSGDTMLMHSVPLTDNRNNTTMHFDLRFRFGLSGSNPTLTLVSSDTTDRNNVQDFSAGVYEDAQGGLYDVSGSAVLGNGRTAWNVQHRAGILPLVNLLFEASWVTGSLDNHPVVSDALFPDGSFSFGVVGTERSLTGV